MSLEEHQDKISEEREPVRYQGSPAWLMVTKKYTTEQKPVKKILKNPDNKGKIVPEFKIIKKPLWLCKRCEALIEDSDNPTFCEQCKRASSFKNIIPSINPDLWILPEWNNDSDTVQDKKKMYEEMLKLIKKLVVFSSDIEYKIFTLWIISTWKLESWDTVGFPIFIGIPNSGKSRSLRIISELGYRAPKASGVTAAAVPRLTHYHNATILIDEAHSKLNPKKDSGSDLLDFIKDSYKKGSVKMVCDNNDQSNIITYRNFGFKAIAGEKTFETGLLSRAIVFYMDKSNPEIPKLSYVSNELNELRTKLLNYRFTTDSPPDLGLDFVLKGRSREIFESIVATGNHLGIPIDDIIQYAAERELKEEEEIIDSVKGDILRKLKERQENPERSDSPEFVKLSDIAYDMGWNEDIKKGSAKVGYHLKDMGLVTKRKAGGTCFYFKPNEGRLKNLYRRYKLHDVQTSL